MSFSDSDSSSYGGDYKSFRQISRDRLLHEMLRSAKTGDSKSTWKVLIMDKLTVKIMSYSCKMADITDEGVSLVEDIYRRRQPLPSMDAIYFIQPSRENVIMFLSDMSGRSPLYRKAFVFFSSPISKELVSQIKRDSTVLPRIAALKEMNLEYFAIDSQGFTTNNEKALEELFCDDESSQKGVACLNEMAIRVGTVFASLREFPFVRYRAAKSLDATTMTTFRDLIPTKVAAGVYDCITKYKKTIPDFPQSETCELLILDRSIDQIAPVIHEWTYDAMCRDLLSMEGNKYVHEVPSKVGGPPEKKEVLLEDHDPVWLELRHAHIADASERLHEKMTNFVSKNKAAQIHQGSRNSSELSTRDLQKMVQALPQYSEQIDKLSLHVEIAVKLNKFIKEQGLRELGQIEQDLVFGDAGTKDVIKFLLNTPCEIDLQPLNQLQARQAVCALMNSLRNPDSWSSMNGNGSPSNHMNQPTPIGRPPSRQMRSPINVGSYISDNLMNGSSQSLGYPVMNMNTTGLSNNLNANSISGLMGTSAPVNSNAFGAHLNENSATAHIFNQYEKWSGNGLDQAFNGMHLSSPDMDKQNLSDGQDLSGAQSLPYPLYPPRSQIKRQKMIYHCKFGEFGVMEGQFTEPSGVAVNAQNDIVVADTNNHRIQVFDKEGRFKFQFGECGKRDGQLLYPNRVSVNRVTGDFIVTERSPTHQIQIYNQYGQFLRKFGANILQHPRGVCVDSQGRIIVVECKVMRVIIFNAFGEIIQKFSCSRYLEFPNGVCTNDRGEILISDNRAHCIKVFNYEGHYLRQIGGEGITNYPIGVGINSQGEVVVADNHNNFNLTIFSQDGVMLNALESKVKHAQCFDVALVDDGSVVLASKDYRLYLYRYQQAVTA